jgi:hypothetical protein
MTSQGEFALFVIMFLLAVLVIVGILANQGYLNTIF